MELICFFLTIAVIVLIICIANLRSDLDSISLKVNKLIEQSKYIAVIHEKLNSLTATQNQENHHEEHKEQPINIPHADTIHHIENINIDTTNENYQKEDAHSEAQQQNEKIHHVENYEYHEQKQKTTESFDVQKTLLGNVFNKVGAIAIIIALIIFIKLVSPYIVLTDLAKVILAYIVGGGLVISGLYFHKKENFKNYGEVLLGTGFADLFITTFCAYAIFDIINVPTTVVIGTILLITTFLLAHKMKTLSMLVIGLIGGYLTPFISHVDTTAILSYMVFINLVSIIFTLRNKNTNYVNVINLLLTAIVFLIYSFVDNNEINMVLAVVLWAIYIIYDFLREKNNIIDHAIGGINYGILTILTCTIFREAFNGISALLGITTIFYIFLAYFAKKTKNDIYKFYEHTIMINLWLLGIFLFNDVQRVIYWSIMALVITSIIKIFDLMHLKRGIILYYGSTIIAIMCAQHMGENCLVAQYNPVLNIRSLLFAILTASMVSASYIVKEYLPKMQKYLFFGGLSLIYIYLIGEINSIVYLLNGGSGISEIGRAMIDIIICLVYAINIKYLGKINNSELFNGVSLIVLVCSLVALPICSGIYKDPQIIFFNLRVAAYLTSIITCIVFTKWDDNEAYKYVAVIFGFLLCHSESNHIYQLNGNMEYMISLAWVLYSGITTVVGIINNKKYLINTGIVLIVLTILRIFIYDLANVEPIYKLVAFLALGIILMFVSYIYTKNKNK